MRLVDEARKYFNIDFNPIDNFDSSNCNRFRVVENKISFALQTIKHFSETAAIKFMNGEELPKRAQEGLENVLPGSNAQRERSSLGFNLRYPPCARGQHIVHSSELIITKKSGSMMLKLVLIDHKNFVYEYLMYGDELVKEYIGAIDVGVILKRVRIDGDKWVKSLETV